MFTGRLRYGKNATNHLSPNAALDAKQAEIIWDAARNEANANGWLNNKLRFVNGYVYNKSNEASKIEVLNSDSAGASGIKPDIMVCDELAFWNDNSGHDLFQVLFSGINKRSGITNNKPVAQGCFIIISNALILDSWQDKIRMAAKCPSASGTAGNDTQATSLRTKYGSKFANAGPHAAASCPLHCSRTSIPAPMKKANILPAS